MPNPDSLYGVNTFKANILENLTTGMYQDSKVIYREYIQNACDGIDMAVHYSVLPSAGDGKIEIWIDHHTRTITIEDNGTGTPASKFVEMLTTIGGSQKQFDRNKGLRGMGRLCGLGYCTKLVFTSSAKGELVESVLTCDALTMRGMINEHNAHNKDYTAIEVLRATTKFNARKTSKSDDHFFRVEMIGISEDNKDLLDKPQVKDYLTFVAPVPYRNTFEPMRNKIRSHAKKLGQTIDEYSVSFDGEAIYKEYTPTVVTSKGEDRISDIDFYDFKDETGNLVAWLWFGITKFQAVLNKKDNKHRGLRLRKENIQIGNEDALQKLFKEDRGQHYFVGEVFATDKNLVPNSQRDYFNEGKSRTAFERLLGAYFNGTLAKIYKEGSNINAAIADIVKANALSQQIATAKSEGKFVAPELQQKYEVAIQKAEKKQQELRKIKEKVKQKKEAGELQPAESVIHEIIKSVEQSTPPKIEYHPQIDRFNPAISVMDLQGKESAKSKNSGILSPVTNPSPAISKSPRLVSLDRVKEIIRKYAEKGTAEKLIGKIEEETE
jgi:molecular chaperone HtpG